jgi:signal transduction histidine kinase
MAAKLDAELLIAALSDAGAAVALVDDTGVLRANPAAAALGDLVALARAASARPIQVTVGERTWEVRSIPADSCTVVSGQDVTAREHALRAVADADELLSFAAHELKGPLHVIGLACHVIETRISRNERVDPAQIDQIRRQIVRFTRLINELLDLSRLRERRLELLVEPIDLVDVVRSAAQVEPGRAADAKLDLPTPPLSVRGDRIRIAEIVAQLVDNAARYTPAGTPIEVTLASEPGQAVVTVADRGPGVPATDVPALFEPRTARGRTPSKGRQGLGLGLHLARELARLHGGDLTYVPNTPSGARFRVTLPR